MSEDRERRWRLALGGEDDALSKDDQRLSGALTSLYGEGDDGNDTLALVGHGTALDLTLIDNLRIDGIEIARVRQRLQPSQRFACGDMQHLATKPFVSQYPIHFVVTKHAPEAELLPVRHGSLRENGLIGREGPTIEGGITGIE